MTRILVCGMGEDAFVHKSLDEVNKIYGPISCVIHSNHPQALAWQQEVSEVQVTRHLPVLEDWRDGLASGTRHRDRMFAAKPAYLVVFSTTAGQREGALASSRAPKLSNVDKEDKRTRFIIHRAQADGIPVLTYTDVVRAKKRTRAIEEVIAC